jgi:hypothetical protein
MANLAKYYTYRNLHNDSFSIKHRGLVIHRPTKVLLVNVEFKVSEKGRQRVLSEKRKNVHALLTSEIFELLDDTKMDYLDYNIEIYYNPYKTKNFIVKETGQIIKYVQKALCINNKIFIRSFEVPETKITSS